MALTSHPARPRGLGLRGPGARGLGGGLGRGLPGEAGLPRTPPAGGLLAPGLPRPGSRCPGSGPGPCCLTLRRGPPSRPGRGRPGGPGPAPGQRRRMCPRPGTGLSARPPARPRAAWLRGHLGIGSGAQGSRSLWTGTERGAAGAWPGLAPHVDGRPFRGGRAGAPGAAGSARRTSWGVRLSGNWTPGGAGPRVTPAPPPAAEMRKAPHGFLRIRLAHPRPRRTPDPSRGSLKPLPAACLSPWASTRPSRPLAFPAPPALLPSAAGGRADGP